jgi:hypothetical protein
MATDLVSAFDRMGVRVRYRTLRKPKPAGGFAWQRRDAVVDWQMQQPVTVNVLSDECGEYFEVVRRLDVILRVPEVVPHDRHLLLTAHPTRVGWGDEDFGDHGRSTFLCGHDERAWFAAAIPEEADARSVQQAKDALKPEEVWDSMKQFGVPRGHRNRRKTDAFVRQGEWFFIACPEMEVQWAEVIYNEPIRRGRGKPHTCEIMYRRDGRQVYVCDQYPKGLTTSEYNSLARDERLRHKWEQRVRDAEVFVRGKVEHADHETVDLPFWHKVVMNTETRSRAMANLAFLD